MIGRRKFLGLLAVCGTWGAKPFSFAGAAGTCINRTAPKAAMLDPSNSVEIDSREYWNDTAIVLVANRRYLFSAEGSWDDASMRCDADGWTPDWGEPWIRLLRFKREPMQPLFKLIGAIDKNKPYIPLGTSGTFAAPASGRLYCFANDVPFFYWNNSGKIRLQIKPE